jgi:hypothetical protein
VILAVLGLLLSLVANLWTEVLWFDQLGFRQVFTTMLLWQVLLFVVGAALMAGAVFASLLVGYRSRPVYAPVDDEQAGLDRYRESLEPLRRLVLVALPAGLALFAGSALSQRWQTVLLFLNREPFGERDPQFGLDIGFFVFTLPLLRLVTGFLTAVLVLALIAGVATHYLYGGIRLAGRGARTTPAARRHIGLLAAVLLLVQAGTYWLDRYSLLTTDGDLLTGASYTGVNAVLPAKTILAMIAVTVALLFVVPIVRGTWRLPLSGVALMVVAAIVIGAVYPALIQFATVRPSQETKESPYLQRNIEATRAAYGLDTVEVETYSPETQGDRNGLAEDALTTASIRLLDPALVSDTFRQLQRSRGYYNFPDSLDVGRYAIDGEVRDTVIAVRELDLGGLSENERNWVNDHTVYTHGFGVTAAFGNQRSADGAPAFFQQGIPSRGELGDFEQRIYFGEKSQQFSIVGGPDGADPRELDYPTDDTEGSSRAEYTFEGDGGPVVGDPLTRLLYAIKFRDQNILLSDSVNPESQILYDRTPRERVKKVAPFLTLDGDPYPAVVDGRVKWIVDAYTTTNAYPYSDLQPLEDATADSLTGTTGGAVVAAQGEVNYIRNSVKATVDAYDGSVELYAWDEEDPILKAWRSAFPEAVQPLSEIDGELMSHLRYPEDLFKVQREVLARYHVTDPGEFFSGQDRWQVPEDPTNRATEAAQAAQGEPQNQPPYYLTLRMPGQEQPAFSLTSTFIPRATSQNRSNVLSGFLAVDADAGNEAGERAEGYGTLRLLQLPRDETVAGPGQVQADFNSEPTVQIDLNRLREGNSDVVLGNLLTLPVGGGLLYVQPVYVKSTEGSTSYPLLRKVLVAFGGDIGYADTLDEALDQVFDGDSGADAGDAETDGEEPTPDPDGDPGTQDAQQRLTQALDDASQALTDSAAALAAQDFAAYGEAQAALTEAIEAANAAQEELTAATAAP